MPIVASFIAIGLYLTLLNSPLPPFLGLQPSSPWYTLVYSAFFTGVLWLVTALPYCYLSTVQGANPRNYNLLNSRLHQLEVRLGINELAGGIGDGADTNNTDTQQTGISKCDKHRSDLVKEASVCCNDIRQRLKNFPVGFAWIIGTGYNSAWTLLHHAEEVMIEVADVETVAHEANHDFLAIEGSGIERSDELLDNLVQAVVQLVSPGALVYFNEYQPRKSIVALRQLKQVMGQSPNPSNTAAPDSCTLDRSDSSPHAQAVARAVLREVRSTLNDYRDKRWEGLVHQRSQLLRAMAVTGIVTYTLLSLTILSTSSMDQKQVMSLQKGILAATMFYIVGAIAGLFVRFYSESQANTSVDDFGLSTTRLIAIPLLSGIAGILGVLVAEMLAGLGEPALLGATLSRTLELPTLFTLDPRLLITAAIFGVTPNLVIKGLQQKANEYENQLQSSKAAESTRGRNN
ncbi:MAG TPA: hypothetical protein VEI53_06375 [Ktedonobacteraceae bacterium]|nr:hypothetical protein [Ktedonobacteraceae bacterium]